MKVHFYLDNVFIETKMLKKMELEEAKKQIEHWLIDNKGKTNRAILITETKRYEILSDLMKWIEL